MQYPVRHVVQAHVVLGVSRRVPVRAVGDVVVFEVDANLVRRRESSKPCAAPCPGALVARTAVERIHDAAPLSSRTSRRCTAPPSPSCTGACARPGRRARRPPAARAERRARYPPWPETCPGVDGSHQRLEPRELGGVAEVGVPHRIPGGEHVPQSLRLIVARRRPRGFLRSEAHAERGEKSVAQPASARRRRRRPRAAADARVEVPTADRRAVVAGGGGFIRDAGSEAPAAVVRLAVAGVVALSRGAIPATRLAPRGREGGGAGTSVMRNPRFPFSGTPLSS